MTGRVKIIRVTTEIKEGRKEPTTEVFYECWCDVQSLGTNEKYTALQAGLENTIVFKVRNCKRMKEVRKKMKELMLMQEVVASNTTGIVESVTQFQKDAVIDEYTQQLIEEGLI